MREIPLSILDLAPVDSARDAAEALRFTTELAQRGENLGYRRFWVAEHHNMPAIASSSPPVLMAHLAAATTTIRIGSGGVMLPNHTPLIVAEQFGTLASLHGGRIDLGIGRAPGTDGRTAAALRRSPEGLSGERFPTELLDLIGILAGDPERIAAVPMSDEPPQVWLLGSSDYSARLAGTLGLPFSFAHHFSPRNTESALALYRKSFRASQWLAAPHTMIAVNVTAADSDERAAELARPGWITELCQRRGRPIPFPTVNEAAAYEFSGAELNFVNERRYGQAVGSVQSVDRQLTELVDRTGVDELMVASQIYDVADRLHSYELVAHLVGELSAAA